MTTGELTLGEIVAVTGATVVGPLEASRPVGRYSLDTRTLAPGDLFVAVRGDRFDGAEFSDAALSAGAVAVLAGRVAGAVAGTRLVVEDVRDALQRLAAHHRDRLRLPVIAVTGTNGKTTTKDVVTHVLSARYAVTASKGNLNSQLGLPLCLLNQLRPGAEVGVFEVGMSAPGEIARLARILKPTVGVVTNVGSAHLEFLGSVENVYEAKSELVDALSADGRLILNGHCRYHSRMRDRFRGTSRIVLRQEGPGPAPAGIDLSFRVEAWGLDGTRGTLEGAPGLPPIPVCMPVPGLHMVIAALQAVEAGRAVGLDVAEAARALAGVRATPHRMEVRRGRFTVIDDCYNANPDSTSAALDFLATLRWPGRKIAVLGDMLELGESSPSAHRDLIERVAGDPRIGLAAFVGPLHARAADHGRVADPGDRLRFPDTTEEAGRILEPLLDPGDLVLLKGSRGIGLDRLLDRWGFHGGGTGRHDRPTPGCQPASGPAQK